MALPEVGETAPDFTLMSTSGSPVTLSDHRGSKVLLAFFPAAFTSVCTAEMCSFSDDYREFQEAGVTVLPISVDLIPSLAEFKRKEGLALDLLSDARREVSRLYGTLNDKWFSSYRAYVAIDRDGVVRWAYREASDDDRRSNGEILEQLGRMD